MKKVIAISLIILPYALLKAAWNGEGPTWPYWASAAYASFALLIIGVACSIFPHNVAKWVRGTSKNNLTELPQPVLAEYRLNGIIVLVFFFLHTFIAVAAYVRCPLIICS